jgi:ABC-type nitrate/sulfonate/bicarbonate transport system substrate-binding protein
MLRSQRRGRARLRITAVVAGALLLAACGGGADEGAAGDGGASPDATQIEAAGDEADGEGTTETIEFTVSPSGLPVYVASQEGLFEGVDIEVNLVGYDQSAALFLAGDTPLGWEGPVDVAEFVAEGEEFRYFSTAGATNMINGLVIRAEDAEKYQSIEDLVGQRVGNPGAGTGTWKTFQVVLQSQFDLDPSEAFDNITADSGALLGLLESGEIEAALLFSGQSAAALALDQFETVFSFTEAWQEATGHPMVVNGPVARASWLEENPDIAAALIDGIDAAVQWIKDHPEEFQQGGKYEEWVEAEGWLRSPETTEGIMELIQSGEWYTTSDVYTEDWIADFYGLIEQGQGVLVEEVPARDEIFYPPSELAQNG